jgi:molybdate transport system ATP-binding protein
MTANTEPQMPKKALQIALQLQHNDFTLKVDLALPAHGISVLFGPSGSGKTTLLRCVAGLEKAQGHVRVADQVWQHSAENVFLPVWSRELGYVFQEASLFEHLSVRANLSFGVRRVKPALKAGAALALKQAIELLGIGHLLDRQPAGLSGGERQRVAIARALATQPRILLLDEPLAALDLARKQEVLPWLERLHRDLRIPVLYVTHSMEELTRLADYVVLMNNGSAPIHGAAAQVLGSPEFASQVGSEAGALLNGVVAGHDHHFHLTGINVDGNTLWVRDQNLVPNTPVRLHVHANDVSIALEEPRNSSIQNRLQGVVVSVADDLHPAQVLVNVRCHEQRVLCRITRRALTDLHLEPGTSVWLQIKSVALAGY